MEKGVNRNTVAIRPVHLPVERKRGHIEMSIMLTFWLKPLLFVLSVHSYVVWLLRPLALSHSPSLFPPPLF